jgi:hypothetical protein
MQYKLFDVGWLLLESIEEKINKAANCERAALW